MTYPLNHLPIILIFTSLLAMATTYKHVLLSLLNLELITLTLIMTMAILTPHKHMHTPSMLLLLSMVAIEGAQGLAILVLTMRTHGNDTIKSISTTFC